MASTFGDDFTTERDKQEEAQSKLIEIAAAKQYIQNAEHGIQLSIAISLKRIADIQQKMYEKEYPYSGETMPF